MAGVLAQAVTIARTSSTPTYAATASSRLRMTASVNFRSASFLRVHVLHTMAFYDGRCLDPRGGFYAVPPVDGPGPGPSVPL